MHFLCFTPHTWDKQPSSTRTAGAKEMDCECATARIALEPLKRISRIEVAGSNRNLSSVIFLSIKVFMTIHDRISSLMSVMIHIAKKSLSSQYE